MQVYRLIGADGWYDGRDFNADEDDSPLFTNKDRLLKTIRDHIRIASEYVAMGGDGRMLYAPRLEAWQQVAIVTYDLVEIGRIRSDGKKEKK